MKILINYSVLYQWMFLKNRIFYNVVMYLKKIILLVTLNSITTSVLFACKYNMLLLKNFIYKVEHTSNITLIFHKINNKKKIKLIIINKLMDKII